MNEGGQDQRYVILAKKQDNNNQQQQHLHTRSALEFQQQHNQQPAHQNHCRQDDATTLNHIDRGHQDRGNGGRGDTENTYSSATAALIVRQESSEDEAIQSQQQQQQQHHKPQVSPPINSSTLHLQNSDVEPQGQLNLAQLQTAQENSMALLDGEQPRPVCITSLQRQHQDGRCVHNGHVEQTNNSTSTNNNSNISSGYTITAEPQQTQITTEPAERRYRPQKYCAVCGDKAIACNFNAVTCESCKAFFRRNAFKEQRLKCLFDNRCIIDRVTRRFCSKCRLLKCLSIGMKREWILTDEQKHNKRVKIMQNKQSRQRSSASSAGSPPEPTISADDSSRKLNNNNNKHLHDKNLQTTNGNGNRLAGESKQPSASCRSRRQSNQSTTAATTKVETKDATTSCPDEFELAATGGHLLQYCSLASHCQYCSLRLTGCAPPPPRPIDYQQQQQQQQQPMHHHHHNQQQHQHLLPRQGQLHILQQQQQHPIDSLNPPRNSYRQPPAHIGANHLPERTTLYTTDGQPASLRLPTTEHQLIQANLIVNVNGAGGGGVSLTNEEHASNGGCCYLEPQTASYHHQTREHVVAPQAAPPQPPTQQQQQQPFNQLGQ